MPKKNQSGLPKKLFAVRKHDGGEHWIDARESMDDLVDPEAGVQTIGVYQLVEKGELQSVLQYQKKR